MEKTSSTASILRQKETQSFFAGSGIVANIPMAAKFLFCLGLLFLIAGFNKGDTLYALMFSLLMLPAIWDYFNFRRNLEQPLFVLEADHFRVGRSGIRIPYAAIRYFVFDQSQLTRAKVAFSLFP